MTIDQYITEYQSELLRYATGVLLDSHAAQDAVQHAYIELVQYSRKRGFPDNVRAWLYCVVRNYCLSYMRKNKRMTLQEEVIDAGTPAEESADCEVIRQDDRNVVRRAVAALRKSYREVVILKFQENKSYREIADITGLSVSHVGVILHEALLELRKRCKQELEA